MSSEKIHTVVVGGGQAGIAMSEHLGKHGIPHVVLEKDRLAEKWRTGRWDSLVANGPAWHDRFPNMEFADLDPGTFAHKDRIVQYFEDYAAMIKAPIRCGVEVKSVQAKPDGSGYVVETSEGTIEAQTVVAATGPFQNPVIPDVIPESAGLKQIHSIDYRNPEQLPEGAVLVIGAGSSGSQIADELLRSGRRVFLSVGPHERPPLRYRGKDFCWWLGVLGYWNKETPDPRTAHVTIAVSGANGGHTVDFRNFANRGMRLLGRAGAYRDGKLSVAADLGDNIAKGDALYLKLIREADDYIKTHGLDFPEEPTAHDIGPLPADAIKPVASLDLAAEGIRSVIWATGFALDFRWLEVGAYDETGRPVHTRGITDTPGLYFVGLSWLSRRASAFIWGVWHDAKHVADHIAANAHAEREKST